MRVWYVYNTVTLEWMAHTGWPPLVPSLNCWHGFAVAGYVRTSIHVMMLVARTNAEYRIAESHCLSLFWPHSVQCCQQNALVFATTLLSYAVMDALAILFDMRGHDVLHDRLIPHDACRQQELVSSDTCASALDELRDGRVRLELHANHVDGCLLGVSAKLLLQCLHEGVPVLVGVGLIYVLDVLRWCGAQNLVNAPLVSPEELALPLLVDLLGILQCLLLGVVLRIVFFLARLQTVENKSLHVTVQFARQSLAQILGVELEEGALDAFHLAVGAPRHDGEDNIRLGTDAIHGLLEHAAFGLVGWARQELQSISQIAGELLLHDISQILLEELLVSERYLVAAGGVLSGQRFDGFVFVGTPSLGGVMDLL
mmetsp:Transcript_23068/g.64299  ORF Transcript_23068/g.64299 Transcript_23068/m.64299 type:complete len:370 (+) Transcript_23068:855-1964(+)